MKTLTELWRLCDECNRYKWRAVGAFVACLLVLPFIKLQEILK